jgi:hypothetical protein
VINISGFGSTHAKLESIYYLTLRIAWAIFLLLLPLTSFPFFPSTIGGGAVVRPLSIYPLILLLLLVTLPRLVTRPIPRTFFSLVPFLIIAITSSLLSLFRGIEPILGIPVYERVLRTLLTLGVGTAFYLTVSILPRTFKDLDFSLRWIYTGLSIAMLWGSLQAIYVIRFDRVWYDFLNHVQQYISTRHLIENRISGFTYEPNWFAEQISFLLLPLLLASVLYRHTAFRWRWHWITIEWILLVWSLLLMPFTFSRAGALSLVLLVGFGLLLFRFHSSINRTKKQTNSNATVHTRLITLIRYLIEIVIILSILIVPVYLTGTRNSFFARAWDYWQKKSVSLSGYLSYLGFGARLAYGEAAYNTYEAHPLLGVGLGNYAFYFEDMLPYRPLAESPEVLRLITPEPDRNRLITAKNFYLRLMAETGVLGTAAFFTFLTAVLGCALYLLLSAQKEEQFLGFAGLCGLFSFGLAAFTFDSFAIPNMWIVFGLITAATWISKRSQRQIT